MSRSKLFVLAGVVCLMLVVAVDAQGQATTEAETSPTAASVSAPATVVPRLMKFSGTLRDAAGKPVTGPVEVSFALYSTDSGGDPLWTESQSVQADDQGRYTALIGVMHNDGLPIELFTSGEARWLGVQVVNEPEQKPRVLLLSVPYALKAADAETLGGLPASAYMQAPSASGTGVSTAQSGAAASGPGSSTGAAAPPKGSAGHKAAACSGVTSDGTATANSLTMFTTSCNIESSAISQSSGNIGIGTASPTSPLSVTASGAPLPPQAAVLALGAPSGVVPFRMLQNVPGSSTPALIDLETADGKLAQLSAGGTGIFQINATAGNAMAFATNGFTPRMFINTSGNVGIGTTSPSSPLSVVSSGAPLPPQPAVLAIGAPSGVVPFRMLQNVPGSSTPALIDLETSDGKLAQLSAGGTGIFQINALTGNAMAFATNGFKPRMYIDTTGNVGIGTLTPAANLEVSGAAKFDSPVTFAAGQTFPGTGTITGVAAGTDLTGGGTSGGVTLNVDTTKVPTLSAASNTFTGTLISGNGVYGNTLSGTDNSAGVSGASMSTTGMTFGVNGTSSSTSNGAAGVNGAATASSGQIYGVQGTSNSATNYSAGVSGYSPSTTGVTFGVSGYTTNPTNGAAAVSGYEGSTTGQVYGVTGSTPSTTDSAAGVYGAATGASGMIFGVSGYTSSTTDGSAGVYGAASATGAGVIGSATGDTGAGVVGNATGAHGVGGLFLSTGGGNLIKGKACLTCSTMFVVDSSGNGFFAGNLSVSGAISAGTKDFKIDDPLDPDNKFLYHASIESSEMMNLYTGNVTTDPHGDAVVELPAWFQALNRDFRYQLTVIGQFAQAIVAQEIQNNRFKIRTDKANVKVSWQVTGVRHDAWAKAHPLAVEVDKLERAE